MMLREYTPDWPLLLSMLLRLTLAFVLGGLIGLERERVQRYAGLRTHMLVCVGSATVMCTGEYIFWQFHAMSGMDPARLGAQVVSGIGILCAGTILKGGVSVRGLTTATSLWCAACIGLAIGSGNILPGVWVTLIVIVVLHVFRNFEIKHLQKTNLVQIVVVANNTEGLSDKIRDCLNEDGYLIKTLLVERPDDAADGESNISIHASVVMPKEQSIHHLLERLSRLTEIKHTAVLEEDVDTRGMSI